MNAGTMIVRRDGDQLIVDKADETILVSDDLLQSDTDPWLTFDGELLTVSASNGTWRYRHASLDLASRTHLFVQEP